jgi:outer membrane protein OmpA-like peptidoglycan-associated protein
MKNIFFLFLFIFSFGLSCFSQTSDSLNAFTDKEILKLSSLIYELEKKDTVGDRITDPKHFIMKDSATVIDKSLLKDLKGDSIHFYTGQEAIKLSNYIYELEKRDSMRTAAAIVKEKEKAAAAAVAEYQLEEEEQLQYFESVIYFKFDSYVITSDSYKQLDDVVKILETYKNLQFVIEGYCDIVGSKAYNKVLSLRRANAVKDYFVKKKKIAASRVLTVTGFGADKFAAPNNTVAGRAKNRRVIIKAVH